MAEICKIVSLVLHLAGVCFVKLKKHSFVLRLAMLAQVGALVNNAAVMRYDWTKDSFDTSYATNFEGPLQLAEKVVPHIKPGNISLQDALQQDDFSSQSKDKHTSSVLA